MMSVGAILVLFWGATGGGGGAQTITASGIASAEAVGTARLNLQLRPTGLASGETIGSHLVSTGGLVLQPTGLASGETVGAPVVLPGPVTIVVSGIASAESVGSPMVVLVESQTPRRVLAAHGRVYTIDARARDYVFTGTA
jgi:hypothetical protein